MPDEDKSFGGALVLDFRKRWRHVKTIYENEFDLYKNELTDEMYMITDWCWHSGNEQLGNGLF